MIPERHEALESCCRRWTNGFSHWNQLVGVKARSGGMPSGGSAPGDTDAPALETGQFSLMQSATDLAKWTAQTLLADSRDVDRQALQTAVTELEHIEQTARLLRIAVTRRLHVVRRDSPVPDGGTVIMVSPLDTNEPAWTVRETHPDYDDQSVIRKVPRDIAVVLVRQAVVLHMKATYDPSFSGGRLTTNAEARAWLWRQGFVLAPNASPLEVEESDTETGAGAELMVWVNLHYKTSEWLAREVPGVQR